MSTQTQPTLVELLDQLALGKPRAIPYGYLTEGAHDELPQLIQDIVGLACDELIKPDGRPNYAAHQALQVRGYRVTPGEVDSFGWLSGIIHTPLGMIVYG